MKVISVEEARLFTLPFTTFTGKLSFQRKQINNVNRSLEKDVL